MGELGEGLEVNVGGDGRLAEDGLEDLLGRRGKGNKCEDMMDVIAVRSHPLVMPLVSQL